MGMSDLNRQFAQIVFPKVDTEHLAEILNAATVNDTSNLGLNADEQAAYNNIMQTRKVTKELADTSINLDVDYSAVNDPGGYLDVLTGGQDAPEITGTVHLPQGGTRKSNVKFWYDGQVYEEGAKDPVILPDNDARMLNTFGEEEVSDKTTSSIPELTELSVPVIEQEIMSRIGGG